MDEEELEDNWRRVRGEARNWWGLLTDEDLARVGESLDALAGMLQERYGYDREAAKREIERRLAN